MTSAATLHCPHCMAEVPKRMVANVPGLILIDRYYCWNCGTMTIREELVQETTLNVLRSGRNPIPPPPFSFTFGGSAADNNNSATSASTGPDFVPISGEMLVCCIALEIAPANGVVSVEFGGAQFSQANSGSINIGPTDISGSMWYLPNAPQVSSNVSATFSSNAFYAISVGRVIARNTLLGTNKDSDYIPFTFDSGGVGGNQIGDLAIAMLAANEDVSSGVSFNNGFSTDALIIDPSNPGVMSVAMAHKLVESIDGGTVASQGQHGVGNWVSIVGTFR